MEHYSQSKRASIKSFIELLNKLGLTVVSINSEFYASNDFECQDPSSSIFEHTVHGRDITIMVENNIDNQSVSEHRQREIATQVSQATLVRRRFHKDIKYVVYSSQI